MASKTVLRAVLLTVFVCLTSAAAILDCSTYCKLATDINSTDLLVTSTPAECECVQEEEFDDYSGDGSGGNILTPCEIYCEIKERDPSKANLIRPGRCTCDSDPLPTGECQELECPEWYHFDKSSCKCVTSKCPSHYVRIDERCEYCDLECSAGYYVDNRCECALNPCPEGSIRVGDNCEVPNCDVECPEGTYFDNLTCQCYEKPCPLGYQSVDDHCEPCEQQPCPKGQYFYQRFCQCRACYEKVCPTGQTFDHDSCSCVGVCKEVTCPAGEKFLQHECRCYPCEPIECSYGYVYDRDQCKCVRGCELRTCPDGHVFEPSNCECYPRCDPARCPFGKIFLPDTCSCVQGQSITDTCPWDHWKNVITQKCEPCNPDDCSVFNYGSYSFVMGVDYETCSCIKSYCTPTVCRENTFFDHTTCFCRPNCWGRTYLCPLGQIYDSETCSCVDNCTPIVCKFGQFFDTDLCSCRSFPCQKIKCKVGELFDEKECRCRPICSRRARCPSGQTWHEKICGCRRCNYADQPCLLPNQKWARKTCSCEDCIQVPRWLCPLVKHSFTGLNLCNCVPDNVGDYNYGWFAHSSSYY